MKKIFAHYINFVKGLNTDLGLFNTDPSECIDILNIKLNLDGSISTRKGLLDVSTDTTYQINSNSIEKKLIPINWRGYTTGGNYFNKIVLINTENISVFDSIFSSPTNINYITSKTVQKITQTVNYGDPNTSIDDKIDETVEYITVSGSIPANTVYGVVSGNNLISFADTNLPNIFYIDNTGNIVVKALVPMRRENITSEEKSIIQPAYTTEFPSIGLLAFGRLWYAGENTKANRILFSQTYQGDIADFEKCYTEKSPYDPQDSQVVATDGGEIYITGADKIVGLIEFKKSIIVLATNGIWQISSTNGFDVTDYKISKLSDKGCVSRYAYTIAEDYLIFASYSGIYAVTVDPLTTELKIVSITENKINKLYLAIPNDNLENISLSYNNNSKELYVFCNLDNKQVINEGKFCHYNNILIFNFQLKAWYIYTFENEIDTVKFKINSIFYLPLSQDDAVIKTNNNSDIITNSNQDVYVNLVSRNTYIVPILIFSKINGTNTEYKFVYFTSKYNVDFYGTEDEYNYDCYIKSSFQIYGDVTRKKGGNYLYLVLKLEDSGVKLPVGIYENPQNLKYRVGFDFITEPIYNVDSFNELYITNQMYGKERRVFINTYENTLNKAYEVIPIKLLGRGKALQFEFKKLIDKFAFKCLSDNITSSPLTDNVNWEMIEYDSSYSNWTFGNTYNIGDIVKIEIPYSFTIQGWACGLIYSDKSSEYINNASNNN